MTWSDLCCNIEEYRLQIIAQPYCHLYVLRPTMYRRTDGLESFDETTMRQQYGVKNGKCILVRMTTTQHGHLLPTVYSRLHYSCIHHISALRRSTNYLAGVTIGCHHGPRSERLLLSFCNSCQVFRRHGLRWRHHRQKKKLNPKQRTRQEGGMVFLQRDVGVVRPGDTKYVALATTLKRDEGCFWNVWISSHVTSTLQRLPAC